MKFILPHVVFIVLLVKISDHKPFTHKDESFAADEKHRFSIT